MLDLGLKGKVAVVTGAPEGTVKARIRSGLRRMHTLLSDSGIGSTWTS